MKEHEEANKIIIAINKALKEKRLGQRQLYEVLLTKGVVEANSENEFKKIFKWALDNNYVDKHRLKIKGKKRGKLPQYFTKDQLITIFDCIDRPKDSVACYLALFGGLRISEVCNLQVKCIDFKSNTIRIEDGKNPNRGIDGYGTDRIVKLKKEAMPPIKAWVDYIGQTSKWVIPSDKSPDQPLRKKSLHERFRNYLRQAKMDDECYSTPYEQENRGNKIKSKKTMYKYHFHCFRHTMASYIYHHTGDIYLVNQFLGHKQLDTTMVYAKLTPIKMTKGINKAFSCLEDNYLNGRHIKIDEPVVQRQPEPQSVKQEVDHTQSMLLAEKQKILSQMSSGQITREECQKMLQDIQEVAGFI